MKILILNYHYFIQGGPDRYFFNITKALENLGHQVIPFCFNYEETIDNPFKDYFPTPITGYGPCLLAQMRLSLKAKLKAAIKLFYNREANTKFRSLIEATSPDLILSVFLADTMLPNLLKIAKVEYGIPVIYRLSDFHFFCASHTFFRDASVCTECFDKPFSAMKYKCVKNSFFATILRVLQMSYFKLFKYYKYIDLFLCPSKVMENYLLNGGFPYTKVKQLSTFSQDIWVPEHTTTTSNKKYILYFGRVTPEKGVDILAKAFNQLNNNDISLKVVGYIDPNYKDELTSLLDHDHLLRTEFISHQPFALLTRTIQNALLVVHPAIWLENMPNSLLEAMSAGKAIVASNIGSIPELIIDNVNGRLFTPGDVDELVSCLIDIFNSPDKRKNMEINSRKIFLNNFTEETHVNHLVKFMRDLSRHTLLQQ